MTTPIITGFGMEVIMSEKKVMLGNEAIARGAYEAGVKVSSAYPGTPSTEISENIVKYKEIYAEWAPNEKVATEVANGIYEARGIKRGFRSFVYRIIYRRQRRSCYGSRR